MTRRVRSRRQSIYFIRGFLYPKELPAADFYEKDTTSIFKAEAPGFVLGFAVRKERPYEFKVVRRCSPAQFESIWTADDTAGIFWYSHGDPFSGDIAAVNARDRKTPEFIEVRELPQSGKNVKFIAVMACHSEVARQEWFQRLRYPRAKVKTIRGKLLDGSMKKGDMTYDFFHATYKFVPQDPTAGARYLMQYAMDRFDPNKSGACNCTMAYRSTAKPLYPKQAIVSDRFERDSLYVPYRRVPFVGIAATHYVSHQIRHGDRVYYLADDYGYTDRKQFTEDVKRLNPGIDFARLKPGQRINVPTHVGIPRSLRPPYALMQRRQLRDRNPEAAGKISGMTALDRAKKALAQTPSIAPRDTGLAFSATEALKRLEHQARANAQTQQWLRNLQTQYGVAQRGAASEGASTLKRLNNRLTRDTRPSFKAPTFDTVSALERVERQAADRIKRTRWLDQLRQTYGGQRGVGASSAAMFQSPLKRLHQRLYSTPGGQIRRPAPQFDVNASLRQIERQAAEQQRTRQWLNDLQRQYR